VKYSSPHMYEL